MIINGNRKMALAGIVHRARWSAANADTDADTALAR